MTQTNFFKSDCSRFTGAAFIECNSKASKSTTSDPNEKKINELARKHTDSEKKISDLEKSGKTLSQGISNLQKRDGELTNSIEKLAEQVKPEALKAIFNESSSDCISKTTLKRILDASMEFLYAVTIVEQCNGKSNCDPTELIQIMQEKSSALDQAYLEA